jgi:hypothetical protein
MRNETYGQHISLVIEGEEITPYVSPYLGGQDLDKPKPIRIYEGMESEYPLSPDPKPTPRRIVFGQDVLCPSCRGRGVATPMHAGEKAERLRAKKRKQPMPTRWECERCGGSGLANIND